MQTVHRKKPSTVQVCVCVCLRVDTPSVLIRLRDWSIMLDLCTKSDYMLQRHYMFNSLVHVLEVRNIKRALGWADGACQDSKIRQADNQPSTLQRALWVFVLRDNLYSCRISLFSDQNHSDSNKSSCSWFISAAWEEKLLINIIQTGTRICSDILLTIFERKQYVGMEYSDEQTKWCIPQCIWPLLMW